MSIAKQSLSWALWFLWVPPAFLTMFSLACFGVSLAFVSATFKKLAEKTGVVLKRMATIDERVGLRLGFYETKQENNDDSNDKS